MLRAIRQRETLVGTLGKNTVKRFEVLHSALSLGPHMKTNKQAKYNQRH